MRYHYFYHSKDNQDHDGWIDAKSRNDAFAALKAQGVRPYKVIGRDPTEWRRWTAICVLSIIVVTVSVLWIRTRARIVAVSDAEERSQVYGDPTLIRKFVAEGWRSAFADDGDAWFARYAIPGAESTGAMGAAPRLSTDHVAIGRDDGPELAKIKRMVNGMKDELAAFLKAGRRIDEYVSLCELRQNEERARIRRYAEIFKTLRAALETDDRGRIERAWEDRNAELREMGLPTVLFPDEDFFKSPLDGVEEK